MTDQPILAERRYARVAIALHWLIALLVLAMIPMGWWMADAIKHSDSQQAAYRMFQVHKSIGFAILGLTTVRLVWRLTHPAPPMPATMKPWERFLAAATHVAFYGLLFALPLSGWLYVSAGWSAGYDQPLEVATAWFGLFPIPHLPFVGEAAAAARRALAFGAMGAHSLLAWGAVVLVALHVGAALKHQFIDRDGVLSHMLPWLKSPHEAAPKAFGGPGGGRKEGKAAPILAGLGLVAVLIGSGWIAAQPQPRAQPLAEGGPVEAGASAAISSADAITPGRAQAWVIDTDASTIGFSGTHAGRDFAGRFESWRGHIWFDPDDLAGSKAVVLVETASARTGDATQEGSLRGAEWLNPSAFPTARFEAEEFRRLGDGRYEAVGTLTIKSSVIPLTLPFTLTFAEDGAARMEGAVTLDRAPLDLGQASDPSGAWVSQAIGVTVAVWARPAAGGG